MKKMTLLTSVLLVMIALNFSYSGYAQTGSRLQIIPEPVRAIEKSGEFVLTANTRIVAQNGRSLDAAKMLADLLKTPTGFNLSVQQKKSAGSNTIALRINETRNKEIGSEGYELKIQPSGVSISANEEKGLFYGIQTIFQLLPADITAPAVTRGIRWTMPAADITDYPRFGWRGLMLDVSRHFFPKEFVLRYIDQMAKYKFNIFHWHLSDDQGWRVEIKGYPELTSIGAWRVPRQGSWWSFLPTQPGEKAEYGGFYTQDEIREVVAYAKARHIEIMPEIDVPGHSLAAIAAYPHLSPTGYISHVNPGSRFWGVEDNTLNPADERVYGFLDTVFTQIAELFPYPYIHIGGDECVKVFWNRSAKVRQFMEEKNIKSEEELQSYFIKRVEKILHAKNRKMVGWDEILEGGLAESAIVMSWRGMEGGIKSAKMGHKVIMTPNRFTYLDLYQGDPIVEPETYSELRLKTSYRFEPVPDGIDPSLILGGQGNLWTESVPTGRQAEYMTWPRAFALAEVLWSPKKERNWNGFVSRVEKNFKFLDKSNTLYARSMYDVIIHGVKKGEKEYQVKLSTEVEGLDIYYTFDGTNPDPYQKKYTGALLSIPKGASQIRVNTFRNNQPVGKQINFPLKELENRPEN